MPNGWATVSRTVNSRFKKFSEIAFSFKSKIRDPKSKIVPERSFRSGTILVHHYTLFPFIDIHSPACYMNFHPGLIHMLNLGDESLLL